MSTAPRYLTPEQAAAAAPPLSPEQCAEIAGLLRLSLAAGGAR